MNAGEKTTGGAIRRARASDVPLLAGLIRDAYRDVAQRFGLTAENCPKHPSNCTTEWIRRDLERHVRYFIYDVGDTPVGCAALEMAQEGMCYLERLCVLPEQRRKGIGRALAKHVLARAGARGADRIGIGIIADQTELKQWYQKMGFVEGDSKTFGHLPFRVTFLTYRL
jgi:N-acetylglutamate synthase-like GNAT family acetyltransferase